MGYAPVAYRQRVPVYLIIGFSVASIVALPSQATSQQNILVVENGFSGSMLTPPTLVEKARIGGSASERSLLYRPSHILFGHDGSRVYITDQGEKSIQVYDRNGVYLFSFGGEGSGPGELRFPTGAYFINENHIAVLDLENARICVYTQDGDYIRTMSIHSDELRGDLPISIGKGEYLRRSGVRPIALSPPGSIVPRNTTSTESPQLLEIVNEKNEVIRTLGLRKQVSDVIVESFLNSVCITTSDNKTAVIFRALNEIQVYETDSGVLKLIITRHTAFRPVVPGRDKEGKISADIVSLDAQYDPDGRLWVLTSLLSSKQVNEFNWFQKDLSGMMRLEVYDQNGQLITTISLERPFDSLTFDPSGDLWLMDSRIYAEVIRYEVRWPQ